MIQGDTAALAALVAFTFAALGFFVGRHHGAHETYAVLDRILAAIAEEDDEDA